MSALVRWGQPVRRWRWQAELSLSSLLSVTLLQGRLGHPCAGVTVPGLTLRVELVSVGLGALGSAPATHTLSGRVDFAHVTVRNSAAGLPGASLRWRRRAWFNSTC